MGGSSTSKQNMTPYHHPRMGPIDVSTDGSNTQLMHYHLVLESQKLYEEWEEQHGSLTKEHPSIGQSLLLPLEHRFQQTNYCGTGGVADLTYEDYLYTLHHQIVNRSHIRRPFNEQELLYLFYTMVRVEKVLSGRSMAIGDIRPENILVNDEGYLKVLTGVSWPGNHLKTPTLNKNVDRFFMAPEECEERHKRKPIIRDGFGSGAAEDFSIGMTILEAGSLEDCSNVYGGTAQYRFNEAKVCQYLEILESRYSQELTALVREMLHPSPRRRLRSSQICDLLEPYQQLIMSLQEVKWQVEEINALRGEEKISIRKIGQSSLGSGVRRSDGLASMLSQDRVNGFDSNVYSPNLIPVHPIQQTSPPPPQIAVTPVQSGMTQVSGSLSPQPIPYNPSGHPQSSINAPPGLQPPPQIPALINPNQLPPSRMAASVPTYTPSSGGNSPLMQQSVQPRV